MVLKEYRYGGSTWQFEEALAPEGAELIEERVTEQPEEPVTEQPEQPEPAPKEKAAPTPRNKARAASTKE